LIELPSGRPFTVGRGVSASFRVRDLKLSRLHSELSVSGGLTIVTDLGSMNGTYVNSKRVASTALTDGDIIQVGYTRFKYSSSEFRKPAGSTVQDSSARPKLAPEPAAPVAEPAPEPPSPLPPLLHTKLPPASVREDSPAAGEPSDREVVSRLRIAAESQAQALKRGEGLCASCRRVVNAKEMKGGKATDFHGQVCCHECMTSDPLMGRTLVGYRIDAKLGSNAWSLTYKAEQLSMARSVVLRVLRPEVSSDNELLTQFLASVKRGGQISHPNLVRIYDIGRTDEFCYVSSEYIDGENLRRRLPKRSSFTTLRAVEVMLNMAGAVAIAHRRDVYHRDIRPSNIIFNDEDIPKLTGLGFAKSLEDTIAAADSRVQHTADLILYWSPECVVDPTQASREADVYSLGAVLYAMLTGGPPFSCSDAVDLVRHIRHLRPKPLGAVRSDVPQRLRSVVAKAMAKNPSDRYSTCQHFIDDLRGTLG
jgi:protein kinase-like protein/FHA domain-containing protein